MAIVPTYIAKRRTNIYGIFSFICVFLIAQNNRISSTLAESISRVDIEALGATVLRSATVLHTDDV